MPEPTPSRTLLVLLAVLLLLRAAAAALPVGWVWGVASARDVAPALAWALHALLAGVLLVAAVGRVPAAPALVRRHWPLLLALAGTSLLLVLPDRSRFVGDFVLRHGILDEGPGFLRIFPQAMPLDAIVNHTLPARLGAWLHVSPALVLRVLALAEGGVLVALATRFARLVTTREATAAAVAVVLCSGGYAALYSGYSKPTPQLVLCALGTLTYGLELVTRGRGAAGLALSVALGLALHRGALPLLLPALVAAVWAWRTPGLSRRALAPLLLPLAVFVAALPRLTQVIGRFDAGVNFTPPEVAAQGGVLAAAFSPLRLLDAGNALLLHAPLLPFAVWAWRGLARERRPAWLLVCFAAFVPVLLFVYLPLGPFRDWDALAPCGVMFAASAAAGVAVLLERSARPREHALAVAVSAAVPLVLWMASLASLDRAFERATALAAGPPLRSATHRSSVYDWLGVRALNEERFALAAQAYREQCALAPSPHALKLWGTAALLAGDAASASRGFAQLTERVPADPVGWYGLWMSAAAAGDTLTASRAAARAGEWPEGGPEMRQVVAFFDHYPRLYALLGTLAR